jgi:hypothetical protein
MILSILLTTTGFGETTETPQRPSRGVIANVPTTDPYWGNALVLERPDTNARRLGALQNGTEVTIAESSGYYTRITSPKTGWVGTRLITITETEAIDPKAPETIESLLFNSKPEKKLNDLTDPQKTYTPYVSETVDFTQFGPLPTPGPTPDPAANGDPAAVPAGGPSAPAVPVTPANAAP